MPPTLSLDAFNFTLAGAREGFGPFLGVYLQQQGFDPARTGLAMSIAGVAGILATVPLGALIDRTTSKRAAVVIAVALISLGAALIVATRNLWLVVAGQVLIGIADSSLAPLVAALTLGLVGLERYTARVARNEAFNHAGNAANAALAALLGFLLGLGTVALAIAAMAVTSSLVIAGIRADNIDHEAARGGEADDQPVWRVLWNSGPLLLLGGTALLFEVASGAMLPFLAQFLTAQGHNPSITTGLMTVTAQLAMVGAALLVPGLAKRLGHRTVLAAALGLVVVRAGLAATGQAWPVIGAVQVLEGVSMGLSGVAIPALAAEAMQRTGHAGAGLGGVMMCYGAGAAVSPALAGLVAQGLGFPAAFLTLGAVAAAGLALWLLGNRRQQGAASNGGGQGDAVAPPSQQVA